MHLPHLKRVLCPHKHLPLVRARRPPHVRVGVGLEAKREGGVDVALTLDALGPRVLDTVGALCFVCLAQCVTQAGPHVGAGAHPRRAARRPLPQQGHLSHTQVVGIVDVCCIRHNAKHAMCVSRPPREIAPHRVLLHVCARRVLLEGHLHRQHHGAGREGVGGVGVVIWLVERGADGPVQVSPQEGLHARGWVDELAGGGCGE
mmetsp:Transcript_7633/g.15041  ORF Transcript_7633/g.15041 Transcript_7633/m.15041 type:complete len:203 (+) Transcript_7633:792-1400(+)